MTPKASPLKLRCPPMVGWVGALGIGALGVALLGAGCAPPDGSGSGTPSKEPPAGAVEPVVDPRESSPAGEGPSARRPRSEVHRSLVADMAAPRHPSDGGGRAWLETVEPVVAGSSSTFVLRYEAGPLGVAEGGAVYLQVSPFWGWSTPQVQRRGAPGYTEVTSAAEGIALEASTADQQLLAIRVGGRDLAAGEQIEVVYGAGPAGARVDRYAERGSRFWFAVDGDGDGVRGLVDDPPAVEVVAGPAARLVATWPSTGRPGEPVRLAVAVLDAVGNAGIDVAGPLDLAVLEGEVDLPERPISLRLGDDGVVALSVTPRSAGVARLAVTGPGGLRAETPPMQVADGVVPIFWGDLQNHSALSDGTGAPEDLYRYARDVAALDVVSITDHDHWGMRFLDQNQEIWRGSLAVGERFHQPGSFVTLPGFEWTSWLHGHRYVLFFDSEDALMVSSVTAPSDHPDELWGALADRRALTLAHHSAGAPIATDWTIPPDPRFETLTEIVSVHGSCESLDSPRPIRGFVAGNGVRDALARGYRLGFVGSSDSHDGHPGLGQLAAGVSGLAAILAEELTRDGVYRALQLRRTYATNGPRIVLRTVLGGYPMGAEVPVRSGGVVPGDGRGVVPGIPLDHLFVQVLAPGQVDRVDVVQDGAISFAVDCVGERACRFLVPVEGLAPGGYLYVRAVQRDGGAAWSSPFFFVEG
ncbi:MAG: DUF3604 domain-containing protein [Acidobacteriota bacterium]